MNTSDRELVRAFIQEMRRYLKSGNDVPVTQVTLRAEELDQLITLADWWTAQVSQSLWTEELTHVISSSDWRSSNNDT